MAHPTTPPPPPHKLAFVCYMTVHFVAANHSKQLVLPDECRSATFQTQEGHIAAAATDLSVVVVEFTHADGINASQLKELIERTIETRANIGKYGENAHSHQLFLGLNVVGGVENAQPTTLTKWLSEQRELATELKFNGIDLRMSGSLKSEHVAEVGAFVGTHADNHNPRSRISIRVSATKIFDGANEFPFEKAKFFGFPLGLEKLTKHYSTSAIR